MNKQQGKTPHKINVSEIFKKYQAQLKSFIAQRVTVKEDREDILQDVFYQLLKTDPVATPIQQISAWLYTVTRNLIIDRKRKHREEEIPQIQTEEGEIFILKEVSGYLFDTDNSPEKEYMRSLVWEELGNALSELPEEQRIVFELNELQNIPFKEISDNTGISVNTLISRKRYAILYLREKLYNLYEELLDE